MSRRRKAKPAKRLSKPGRRKLCARTPSKTRWSDRGGAAKAARELNADLSRPHCRIYRCTSCKGWHLTKSDGPDTVEP